MGRMVHLLAARVQRAQADAEAGPCQGSAGIVRALDDLELEVRRCAAVVGAVERDLPTFGRQEDYARPNLEVSRHGIAYVVVERGTEFERTLFVTEDDLLYRVLRDITFSVAGRHELANRVPGVDSRRLRFRTQVELLRRLSESWAERLANEHEVILRRHPFDDASSVRATLCAELRAKGVPPEAAWATACERYPLPLGS
jgi:hypothetical protein